MEKQWVVYILRCRDDSLYTGITDDLSKRIETHNSGKGAKYTRGRGPVRLAYRELCASHSDALKREAQIKKLPRTQKQAMCAAYEAEMPKESVMTYDQIRKAAGNNGFCHSCPVCNGVACGNTMPGPGCKGSGKSAARNYQAWQELYVNMDTIYPEAEPDTSFSFLGRTFSAPVFAAPMGVVAEHFGRDMDQKFYDRQLVKGCADAGMAAFTADGLQEHYFAGGCEAIAEFGPGIPTIKPRSEEIVFQKIDLARQAGAFAICMDVDAAGLPFLKHTNPPSGRKSVEQLRAIAEYASMPFILKGIMTPDGAMKAVDAGAAAIVVSNHGGRVLDGTPATAWVLPQIVAAVNGAIPVLVDGGIRTGLDVFKALALGADATLIGRPFATCVYGAGAEGVCFYCNQIAEELRDTMAMCGCGDLAEIGIHNLWRER